MRYLPEGLGGVRKGLAKEVIFELMPEQRDSFRQKDQQVPKTPEVLMNLTCSRTEGSMAGAL